MTIAHPWQHALSSAKKFGGYPDDYLEIHKWFDESKGYHPDFRHRALRHHAEGIFLCERIFGEIIVNAEGREVPVRYIGEQHVKEDLGWIPTVSDWLRNLKPESWMMRTGDKKVSEPRMVEVEKVGPTKERYYD